MPDPVPGGCERPPNWVTMGTAAVGCEMRTDFPAARVAALASPAGGPVNRGPDCLRRPSLSFGPQGIHMTPGDRIQQRFAGIRKEGLRRLPGASSRRDLRPRPCHLRPQPAPIVGFG